jgi:hypothetical protein
VTGTTAGTESSLLTRKRHEPLEVALIATHAKEAVFEVTAFEIRFKLSMDLSRQSSTLGLPITQRVLGSVSLQVGRAEFALGDGAHRRRDQGHLGLLTAYCADSNRVEVKDIGAVSYGGEHLKYPTA